MVSLQKEDDLFVLRAAARNTLEQGRGQEQWFVHCHILVLLLLLLTTTIPYHTIPYNMTQESNAEGWKPLMGEDLQLKVRCMYG